MPSYTLLPLVGGPADGVTGTPPAAAAQHVALCRQALQEAADALRYGALPLTQVCPGSPGGPPPLPHSPGLFRPWRPSLVGGWCPFFLKEKQHQSIAWRFIRVFFALVRTLATEKAHKWPITAYIALLGVKNFLPLRSLEKIHQPALLADVPLGVHRHFHPPNLDQLQSNPPPIGYCEP